MLHLQKYNMYIIETIICNNSGDEVVNKIRDKLNNVFTNDNPLKDIYIADSNNNQIVILLSNEEISTQIAKIFWAGFQSALGEE